MNASPIVLLVAGILVVQAAMWLAFYRWLKRRMAEVGDGMRRQYGGSGKFVMEPRSALYRGADARFGNVKGNGMICLTEEALVFEKAIGRKIEIRRVEITEATVTDWFKGKTSFATGGRHLVIRTRDGNRIGFLVRDAELWAEKVRI
ncbi:MAG: hypothetical protein AB1724_01360 [Thermodesulfobacteriota bacterium]